jgi:hypothetical protein
MSHFVDTLFWHDALDIKMCLRDTGCDSGVESTVSGKIPAMDCCERVTEHKEPVISASWATISFS